MGLYRRDKYYWFSIMHNGKRIQQSTNTENKKLAERIYGKVLTEIQEGQYFQNVIAKRKTFEEMMEKYMSGCANKPATIERKKSCLNHLKAAFSGKMVADITPEDISTYKSCRKSEGAADSTVLNEIRMLSNAFNTAIRTWRWCKENPVSHINLGLKPGKVDRWLTSEEEKALMKSSAGKMNNQLTDIIILALNTGLSLGELINLKWHNVDLFRKTLISTRDKTDVTRTIPLNQNAFTVLKKRSKIESISGYVFYNGANNKIDRWKLKAMFSKAVAEAGIKNRLRFHDLRHTFATRMVQRGVDLYRVSKLLGHKDISTSQRYAHHYPESLRSGVEILDCYNFATMAEFKEESLHHNVQ